MVLQERAVHPLEQEGEGFAVVAKNDRQLRKRVEHPAQDQPHHHDGGLYAEPEAGTGQGQAEIGELVDDRERRVQVDRYPEFLSLLQDRPVALVVKVGVAVVRMGVPSLEAQLLDATLQLSDGLFRLPGAQSGKAQVAGGVPVDGLRQLVVSIFRDRRRHLRLQHLGRRGGVRQDRHVDPHGVHGRDAGLVHVQKAVDQGVAEGLPEAGAVIDLPLAGLCVVNEAGVSRVGVDGIDVHLGSEVVLQIDLHSASALSVGSVAHWVAMLARMRSSISWPRVTSAYSSSPIR